MNIYEMMFIYGGELDDYGAILLLRSKLKPTELETRRLTEEATVPTTMVYCLRVICPEPEMNYADLV